MLFFCPPLERLIVVGQTFALAGNPFKSSRKQAGEQQHRVDCVVAPPAAGGVCIDRRKYFSLHSFRLLEQIAVLPRLLLFVPSSAQAVCDALTTRKTCLPTSADMQISLCYSCTRFVFGGF